MKRSHPEVPRNCLSHTLEALPPDVCESVGDVLARVGDKWSILVVYMLSHGRVRFSELKRNLDPISQKVLTSTLRGLERDGYVARHVTPTAPPRVDYELTPFGEDVLGPVTALAMWAYARRTEVEAARRAFDARTDELAPPGVTTHRVGAGARRLD